jgi:hypothetical protein
MVGTFTHRDAAGANRAQLGTRLGGRALGAGGYLLQVAPRRGVAYGPVVTVPFAVR